MKNYLNGITEEIIYESDIPPIIKKSQTLYYAKCPKCQYTSRIPEFEGAILNNKNSVHSKVCPKHRLELVRVIYELKNSKSNSVKNQKWQEGC